MLEHGNKMVVSSDSTSETPQVHTMAFRLIDHGPATSAQILVSSDTNAQSNQANKNGM